MKTKDNQSKGSLLDKSGVSHLVPEEAEYREWMKVSKKDRYASVITHYAKSVAADWLPSESRRIVDVVERLMFDNVDVDLLLKHQIDEDGVTFSFYVVENIASDELLDTLMEYHPSKWHFIQDAFLEDGCVDLVYEDRYLNSPLGCLLLAQFIRRLKDMFALTLRSVRIVVSKTDFRVIFDDESLKIDRRFSYVENRDRFLRLCMDDIVGESYELEIKNTKHFRSLTVCNRQFGLSIHPDGGISHGWGVENGKYSNLTIDALKQEPDINIPCFNRAAHEYDRKGIHYMVNFSPLRKDVK